ncbi:MAG TPA: hypothetical protein VG267_01700 [Terracidiphilus sp.]|jgi:hypothetical protein|nr:hypothetical protein [Terracidiphilus sp.]
MILLAGVLLAGAPVAARAEDPAHFVQRSVDNELAMDRADHSHWLFFEGDLKPGHLVRQWVAETIDGDLRRVVETDGHPITQQQQQQRMDAFVANPGLQAKQRKSEAHDDREAEEMLQLLPHGFIWTRKGEQGDDVLLHFRPNPDFKPPDLESKVFAAMEGDLRVNTRAMRIASIKGRLIQNVKILGGLFGQLDAGGTFDVERRETGGGVWQITETHVHIQGHALIFKNISEQEDDVKWDFKPLPDRIVMRQAEKELMEAKER